MCTRRVTRQCTLNKNSSLSNPPHFRINLLHVPFFFPKKAAYSTLPHAALFLDSPQTRETQQPSLSVFFSSSIEATQPSPSASFSVHNSSTQQPSLSISLPQSFFVPQ
ncbi:unnamed protein product [Cuscuta europaea]|uniref:Uncharacterized protein n=1 Tax=Cuscuta europaea TaxID=41803 RepID=A0A9P0YPZ6_CUSEU|nr:unnamed protein product [Cuscuta europaea]